MDQPSFPSSTMVTFVVRFWRETSAGEVRCRGWIEHVQSRVAVAFLDLEGMLQFLRKFGVLTGHERQEFIQTDKLEIIRRNR